MFPRFLYYNNYWKVTKTKWNDLISTIFNRVPYESVCLFRFMSDHSIDRSIFEMKHHRFPDSSLLSAQFSVLGLGNECDVI